jgi:glycosyltransferase involved in cell wall biosynthesis
MSNVPTENDFPSCGEAMTTGQPKFFIINNGMKDLRGHYLETSVSIAEASAELGFRPILAAHASCHESAAPQEIEFHPVFTVDYWMAEPPLPSLERRGLRGQLRPLLQAPASRLLDGSLTFTEYLAARFEAIGETGKSAKKRSNVLDKSHRRVSRFERTVDRLRRLLPLAIYRRYRARYPKVPIQISHAAIESIMPPSQDLQTLDASQVYATELNRMGARQEVDYTARFRSDLEQLLAFAGCSADDHVFLPTAHGRELVAICQLLQDVGREHLPTFHLEFRHALTEWAGIRPGAEHPFCTLHKVCFGTARQYRDADHVRLYTDTEELARQYHKVTGFRFDVLPIPFRSQLIQREISESPQPLCLTFLGDARDEKGFHWLPELIDSMMDEYVRPGRVRFLLQAAPLDTSWNRGSQQALEKLKQKGLAGVTLVGTDGPLPPEEYFQVVSQTDMLLCPFDAMAYRSRSSGTLAEAIAAGIPTIVPEGTWLARQQPPGTGEAFNDLESFCSSVKKVCDQYSTYHAMAQASRESWLSVHTPKNLVKTLVAGSAAKRRAA